MNEQMAMDLQIDLPVLREFLREWELLEMREDLVRREKSQLREAYAQRLPMRAVQAAVKVVRTRTKLERHPKEPMPFHHQDLLQQLVQEVCG